MYNTIRQQKHVVRTASIESEYARPPTQTQIELAGSVTDVVTDFEIISWSLILSIICLTAENFKSGFGGG